MEFKFADYNITSNGSNSGSILTKNIYYTVALYGYTYGLSD
jgi:hypothetical protein